MDNPLVSPVSRRDLLKLGSLAAAAGAAGSGLHLLDPGKADAQAPKRGGTFRMRFHLAPVHFDPQQTVAFSTMVPLSFTHSRLVKVKAGSSVKPGTQPIEPDLAESWTQPNDTTYIFKLRRAVRWHPKPPVNGRELTAEDVKYTYERFMGPTNPNRGMLEQVEKIEAVDKYTVKFTLKEPFAWLLEALASTSTWIIANYRYFMPGQALNASGVNDPKLTDMIRLQRRTFNVAKRREIIYDIQRYISVQAYALYGPSVSAVAAWEPYVKNFAPNIGHDYGGRLMAAWLDR